MSLTLFHQIDISKTESKSYEFNTIVIARYRVQYGIYFPS